MQETWSLNRRFETVAWGAFFILLGVTSLFPSLPSGTGSLGIGIILLGLNAARMASGIPTSGFTITLGIIALVLGLVDLVRALLVPAFELPVFPLLLIIIGVIWLVRGARRS